MITTISHHITMPPPLKYVNFTSTSGTVVCQKCKLSFPETVEIHFLHDQTGKGPGKKVCDECYQYYITKTQAENGRQSGKLLINFILNSILYYIIY